MIIEENFPPATGFPEGLTYLLNKAFLAFEISFYTNTCFLKNFKPQGLAGIANSGYKINFNEAFREIMLRLKPKTFSPKG